MTLRWRVELSSTPGGNCARVGGGERFEQPLRYTLHAWHAELGMQRFFSAKKKIDGFWENVFLLLKGVPPWPDPEPTVSAPVPNRNQ
jgi:hypothetical protein